MADVLVVGAGLTGCTMARCLAEAGLRVRVVEQRAHVGGMAYDEVNADGILIHRYGPHIFHTNSPQVVAFLSRFTEWHPYEHRVLSSVGGQLVPVPINRTTLARLGCDLETAYRLMFEPYTRKQWGALGVDKVVWGRVPARDNDDDRYFLDAFQMQPVRGFTQLCERMLAHESIAVTLRTAYTPTAAALPVVYTGPIDAYFDYAEGRLPYRATRMEFQTLPQEQAQPVGCINYPDEAVPYTRVTEFKHLTCQRHPATTLGYEYPSADGEPTHPVPKAETRALYERYVARARETAPHVTFAGRLGTYKYLDMDQCVAQALMLARRLVEHGRTHVA